MDPETRRQVEALQGMYPRPRVGQKVKLRTGKVVEIITVRKAREVISLMTETEAMMLGPTMQARYGKHWLEVFFRAEALYMGRIVNVEPIDIESILGY